MFYIFVFCSVDLRCCSVVLLVADVGEFDKFEFELLLVILFIKFEFERLFIISAVVVDIFAFKVSWWFTLFVPLSFELLLLILLLLLVELFTRKWLKVFQSLLINEKSRNSSWLNALTIIGSIGVKVGSSDVKSLSKLLVSRSSFYFSFLYWKKYLKKNRMLN